MTKKNVKKNLLPLLKNGIVPVVTGFIGATKNGHTTTLGRGGSDYTASIIGYALQAEEIQIWTDVDGMYSADPRVVKDARFLSKISYREASEMATFGAKILHPRTIHPAISANIPVKILNTLHPEHPGTLVQKTKQTDADIAVVTCKKQTPLITLYATDMLFRKGFLSRIFDVFTKHHISVDLVSVSEVSVSVTLDNTNNLSEAIH